MELSDADRVWNRAAMEEGGPDARVGDRMLSALLLAHGYVMNGGVLHALELTRDELTEAKQAYEYFGLAEVTKLFDDASAALTQSWGDEVEERLDRAYASLVPDDNALASRFEHDFNGIQTGTHPSTDQEAASQRRARRQSVELHRDSNPGPSRRRRRTIIDASAPQAPAPQRPGSRPGRGASPARTKPTPDGVGLFVLSDPTRARGALTVEVRWMFEG